MSEPGTDCHATQSSTVSEDPVGPTNKRNVFGLIGLCCAAFCIIGLPLLGLALSALGLAWMGHGWVAWLLMATSLSVFGLGLAVSYRRHRHAGPLLVSIVGAGLLVSKPAHLLANWAEWAGIAVLIAVWLWDRRLHRGCHSAQNQTPSFTPGKR